MRRKTSLNPFKSHLFHEAKPWLLAAGAVAAPFVSGHHLVSYAASLGLAAASAMIFLMRRSFRQNPDKGAVEEKLASLGLLDRRSQGRDPKDDLLFSRPAAFRCSWKETLATGIREFDEPHMALFSATDSLVDAALSRDRSKVEASATAILSMLKDHFKSEESAAARRGKPLPASHVEGHRKTLESVGSSISGFKSGKVPVSSLLLSINRDAIAYHVASSDVADLPRTVSRNAH